MEKNLKEMIGKRTKRGIYNEIGDLIIPIDTIITYEHVRQFEEEHIVIDSLDIEEHQMAKGEPQSRDVASSYTIIEDAVEQVTTIFHQVRETEKVSLRALRNDIVPMLIHTAENVHFMQLFTALQAKDDYTYRHNIAVGTFANLLGKWLELSVDDRLELTTAALLHDVGKMLIPDDILHKPSRLTDEEYEVMKKHTVYGYQILKETTGISHRQALVALHHHERMDGSGYPFGLKEGNIDYFSRIVAITDVFHAMTSDRVYRKALPFYEVLYQMERDTFGALDPTITRLFIRKIMDHLIGNHILLTDGREAVIVMIHEQDPTRPLVKANDEFIDLSGNFSLNIEKIL